jgi:glycerophosphoryl diester phosphodiesterase
LNLRQDRVLRIGHRGAPALAPENTLESLAAAIEYGVDLVELDVIAHEGRLRVAHAPAQLNRTSPLLEEALELLAPHEVGVIVDLKSTGVEGRLVSALRDHGVVERSVVASFRPASLRAVKEAEAGLTVGLSYPFDRAGIAERPAFQPLIRVGLAGARRLLPFRIRAMLTRSRADAALLHHALVSRPLVDRCHALGAAVLAWTIEDERALKVVLAAGVDGVIANDPRLLHV